MNLITDPQYIELVNSIYETDVQLYNRVLNERNKNQKLNIIINKENVIKRKNLI